MEKTKCSQFHNYSNFLGNNLCQLMTVSVVVYQSESVCVCVLCRHLHRDVIPYWECNIYASNLIKGWKKWLPNFAPTHTWCVWWSMSQCANSTMRDSCMAHAWLMHGCAWLPHYDCAELCRIVRCVVWGTVSYYIHQGQFQVCEVIRSSSALQLFMLLRN